MLNHSKLFIPCALILSSVVSCSDPTKNDGGTKAVSVTVNHPAGTTTEPPPASVTVVAKTAEPEVTKAEYIRLGKYDTSRKYTLAMKKDTTDIVVADQRGMVTPIPFDSSQYANVSFSDPSASGMVLIIAYKNDPEDAVPIEFDLFTFSPGSEKVSALPVKLPSKQLVGWAVTDNRIVLASRIAAKKKGNFDLKVTVVNKAGTTIAEYTHADAKSDSYTLALNDAGDVLGISTAADGTGKKSTTTSFLFKNGKPVSKLTIPAEFTSLQLTLDSMDAEGNVIASKTTAKDVERYRFNPLESDTKLERITN